MEFWIFYFILATFVLVTAISFVGAWLGSAAAKAVDKEAAEDLSQVADKKVVGGTVPRQEDTF